MGTAAFQSWAASFRSCHAWDCKTGWRSGIFQLMSGRLYLIRQILQAFVANLMLQRHKLRARPKCLSLLNLASLIGIDAPESCAISVLCQAAASLGLLTSFAKRSGRYRTWRGIRLHPDQWRGMACATLIDAPRYSILAICRPCLKGFFVGRNRAADLARFWPYVFGAKAAAEDPATACFSAILHLDVRDRKIL